MKLYYSQTSPYARKVRIVSRLRGLASRIEEIETNPFTDTSLATQNPLAKIPTLVLGDGTALYDSPVICEYLDSLGDGESLFPSGTDRWPALRLAALADGLMDAVVALRMESLRPEDKRHAPFKTRTLAAVRRALGAINKDPALAATRTIGSIAVTCALGYLDLRLASENWRGAHTALERFYTAECEQPAVAATAHPVS